MNDIIKYFFGFLAGGVFVSIIVLWLFLVFPPSGNCPEPVECPAGDSASETQQSYADFSGTWYTTWGQVNLEQNGNQVSGTYEYSNGEIEGTVRGNTLEFEWREDTGTYGTGYFVMRADGKGFDGEWKYHDSFGWEGSWSGEDVPGTSDEITIRDGTELTARGICPGI